MRVVGGVAVAVAVFVIGATVYLLAAHLVARVLRSRVARQMELIEEALSVSVDDVDDTAGGR